jgi:hypothetical protein
MRLTLFFVLIFTAPAIPALAQLYTDASVNLPTNGAYGASMDVRGADLDEDGDLDIVLANEFQPNTILINNGSGVFVNGTAGNLPQETHDSEDVAIADFNGDGHLDLVFCSEDDVNQNWTDVHEYYLGDGNGHFTAAAYQPPDSEANAVISADINGDGLPDLLFGNKGTTTVLINAGNGGFNTENDRVPALQRTTQDLALADVDLDGDADLFLGNENGNLLFINDGTGHFTDGTAARLPQGVSMETRKVTFGDVDGDNDPDVFLSNVGFLPGVVRQNRLYLNDGAGHFTDATAQRLPADNDHTIDAIFEDVDLDADLDLVLGNVFGGPIKVYRNDGAGFFTDATLDVLGELFYRDALGVIAADLNGDGLRDLYVCDRVNPNSPKKDLLLLRSAAVATAEAGKTEIQLYPNPVGEAFFIRTGSGAPDSVILFDLRGNQLYRWDGSASGAGSYRYKLPAALPAGVYTAVVFRKGQPVRIPLFVSGR